MGVGNCGAMNPCSRKLADTLGARTGPRGNRDDLPRRPLRRSFIELPASSQRRSGTSSDLARTGPSVEPAPAVSDLMSDAFAQARSEQGRTTAGPEAIAPPHPGRFGNATMEATFNCGVGLVLVVVVASVSADVLCQRACASRSARSRARTPSSVREPQAGFGSPTSSARSPRTYDPQRHDPAIDPRLGAVCSRMRT